ncbi:MAG: hypothetical protein RLZZ387_3375 [Chloroflexota bacterium]|jgi:sugar/nucleoside kinase (ribokinase family)
MEHYDAVVAGHLCLDIIPALSAAARFTPGRSLEAGPATLATGGAVSNTGVALHRLGVTVRLVGKLGDDLFGQAIRRTLDSHGPGLTDALVTAAGESSSYTIILSPPGADRMFIHHTGCNATFTAGDVDQTHLVQARLLHYGYPPTMRRMHTEGGRELAALLRRAKEAGATTSLDWTMFDPRGPAGAVDWRAVMEAALPHVDIFTPNIEELLLALDRPAFERLDAQAGDGAFVDQVPAGTVAGVAEELLRLGPAVVGIKAGHRGMYLRTAGSQRLAGMGRATPTDSDAWAGRELWAPCYAVDVVGTTGAGDATTAGFLMGLLRGFGPEAALQAANAVGACSVEAADSLGGVRGWPETRARIDAGWARLPLEPGAPGWRYDGAGQIWIGPNDTITRRPL